RLTWKHSSAARSAKESGHVDQVGMNLNVDGGHEAHDGHNGMYGSSRDSSLRKSLHVFGCSSGSLSGSSLQYGSSNANDGSSHTHSGYPYNSALDTDLKRLEFSREKLADKLKMFVQLNRGGNDAKPVTPITPDR